MEQKEENGFKCFSVTKVDVSHCSDGERIGDRVGVANVVLNEQLDISGLRIMEGPNGLFVEYPTLPTGYNLKTTSKELWEHIEKCVLEKYWYEKANETSRFVVELNHRVLFGVCLSLQVIAKNENEAESKAIEKAVELIPSTKYHKDEWNIIKVEASNQAEEKKYNIGFRLYAEVELTEEEIKAVAKGDSTCVKNKYQAGEVKLGGGDSYIPLDWIRENDGIPMDLRQEFDADVEVDI